MINAFKFGAPPHGGSAPGIDRIVMLLADEPNIREVIVFPMNQKAEDLDDERACGGHAEAAEGASHQGRRAELNQSYRPRDRHEPSTKRRYASTNAIESNNLAP